MTVSLPAQKAEFAYVSVIPSIADKLQHSAFWDELIGKVRPETASSFWTREQKFTKLIEVTNQARANEVGWDGYEAPNPNKDAINRGVELLSKLKASGLDPYSVLPSADGGIGISFRGREGRRAILEILNDGSSTYMIYGKGHPTMSDAFDIANPNLTPVFTLLSENL